MSSMTAEAPASTIAKRPRFKAQYDHYIDGEWVAPCSGEYFDNISPIDGKPFTKAVWGNAQDIAKVTDAAHQAFAKIGGYKKSGFGRENHKIMLNHYRQTKNMLISYSKNKLKFF